MLDLKEKVAFNKYYDEAPEDQIARIWKIKADFGTDLMLVAHHYQKMKSSNLRTPAAIP